MIVGVSVIVGVKVGVSENVSVGLSVAVLEMVGVGLSDGVEVIVAVGLMDAVLVGVPVGVKVAEFVGVFVMVAVGVLVAVSEGVLVAVLVGLFVGVLVMTGTGVLLGVVGPVLLPQAQGRATRVRPMIDGRAHPAAFLARLRFGRPPIMAVGRTIWWPNARRDFAGTGDMAILQHELQHILDFAEGRLTVLSYLLLPRNWRYRWELSDCLSWDRLGAEQRASMAEALWRAERSSAKTEVAATLRTIILWA